MHPDGTLGSRLQAKIVASAQAQAAPGSAASAPLRKGAAVWYRNKDGGEDKATIKAVHGDGDLDDPPYYTIRLRTDASEKNTPASRVRVRTSSTPSTAAAAAAAAAAPPDSPQSSQDINDMSMDDFTKWLGSMAPPKIALTAPLRPTEATASGCAASQAPGLKTAAESEHTPSTAKIGAGDPTDPTTCRFCSVKHQKNAADLAVRCASGHHFCQGCFSGLVAAVAVKPTDELLALEEALDLMGVTSPGSKSWVTCPVAGCLCSFTEQLIASSIPEAVYDMYAIAKEAARDERYHRDREARQRADREADRQAKITTARAADKVRQLRHRF